MVSKLKARRWVENSLMVERVGRESVSGMGNTYKGQEDLKTHIWARPLHQVRSLNGIWNWLVIKDVLFQGVSLWHRTYWKW